MEKPIPTGDYISPEEEYGNVEYKTKLVDKDEDRIEKLASQMAFRTNEGNGESIYVIGVSDNGALVGVSDDEFTESFNNLSIAARKNEYTISLLSTKTLDNDKKLYELMVREKNSQNYIDIKIAIAGAVDAGKSSLLGTLTTGKNDNGRGSARLAIFNFKHEMSSGRTSSIAHHILGFDSNGHVVNYDGVHKKGWPEIVKDSSKIISFFDLCGHEKYLKTTVLGLSSSFPDMAFILVGANMGMTRMTQEHIFLCVTLKIPFSIVVTKVDICKNRQNVLKETDSSINKLLKMPGLRRIPCRVNSKDDAILCANNIHTESVVPIFHVSNVTGFGIDKLKTFLNVLGKTPHNVNKSKKVECHIDTTFSIPGVGTVVGGHLTSGVISVGDKVMIGPNNGKYQTTQVKSIHCKRVPMQTVKCGSYVCLGLKKIDRNSIRRGNVVISPDNDQLSITHFEADITVLKAHSTTIKVGYTPVIHTGTMRQSAELVSIDKKISARGGKLKDVNDDILRTGDRARVKFRFMYRQEYLKPGSKLLMCEGKMKVIGVVV